MSRVAVRPYLIAKDADGALRITIRRTRFNSQGYPLTSATVVEGVFPTIAAARAYVKEEFDAQLTDIALK